MNKYTDQEFTYRQVPVSYDGIAKLDSIKGNTLVWNQQCDPTTYFSTLFRATKSISGTTVTVTDNRTSANASFGGATPVGLIPIGHKVFVSFNFKSYSISNFRYLLVYGRSSDGYSATEQKQITATGTQQMILTPSSYSMSTIAFNANTQTAVTGSTDNFVLENLMVIDLTQMFGSGNEPTIEEFTSLYPLPYYSYNSGSLLSFSGTGIKTVGFNLWDEETRLGYYSANGAFVSQSNTLANKNFIKVFPNTDYYCKSVTYNISIYFYDESGNFITGTGGYHKQNATFTTPPNCGYINFCTDYGSGATYNNDICINISSSKNGTYEPYTSSTLSLPISTYFPTGMKSAGSVYDELTPTRAITRIRSVDLGSLTWSLGNFGEMFTHVTDIKYGVANVMPNMVCASYPTIIYANRAQYSTPVITIVDNSDVVQIRNTGATDPTAFKNSLSGVYLYYELATPTEQDINADLFYKFYGNGTEEVLPVNTDTPSTSPLLADIIYYNTFDSDVPYRKFWFANGNGEEWSLTEKDFKAFLNNPSGLGFKKSIDMVRYGERAVKNSEVYDLPTVTGDLLFYDTANSSRYDRYNEFVRFLMDQPIKLYYQIPVSYSSQIADLYTLDCEVSELRKTESKPEGLLTSNITINGLSFYEGEEVVISGSSTTISIENKGDFAVGFEITIEGTMTNPYFTLEQDEELYGEGRFVDSTAFNSVYVNSNDGEQDLVLQQNGSILPNPLSYQDLSISNGAIYVTFVKLARGVSELKVRGGTISNVTVRFKPMFRSV